MDIKGCIGFVVPREVLYVFPEGAIHIQLHEVNTNSTGADIHMYCVLQVAWHCAQSMDVVYVYTWFIVSIIKQVCTNASGRYM